MAVFSNNSTSIGNTPLVRLNRLISGLAAVYAKIEARNPSYSVKCRLGSALIWDAEERGLLKAGGKIIEPTSGNTGIALASVAAARGYEIVITMPETMSIERRKVMAMLGARIILTPAALGMSGAIAKAKEILESDSSYYMPSQFENPANAAIHFKTTGPEIWKDLDGQVDGLVAGVGTGGTISGTGAFLKSQNPALRSVAVEPFDSQVISQHLAGKPISPKPHKIQGIGAGFIPATLNLEAIDQVEAVTNEEAMDFARRLAREEGILAGISSGAATAAAARLAGQAQWKGKTIVVILPDAGERYLSSELYENIAS